jgi:ribonuclease T2
MPATPKLVRPTGAVKRRTCAGPAAWAVLALWAWSLPAPATVPVDGKLVATRDCPATVSIKQRDPAGGVRLEPGRGYRVLGKNKSDATHYQVVIEGARPAERWVEVDCGTLAARDGGHAGDSRDGGDRAASGTAAEGAGAAPGLGGASKARPNTGSDVPPMTTPAPAAPTTTETGAGAKAASARSKPGAFVLALSWQPAFCEVNRRKSECRDQTPERPDASRFSLHGLWPQPRENAYCGVDARTRRLDREGDWSALPDLNLKPPTREHLARLMPGAHSGLERHEWTSHGTCYGTDADTYFTHATVLTDQVNASRIGTLFAANRGRHLSSNQIRAAFDTEFGRGAGERVRLVCEEGMISELHLSLKGEISDASRIGPLIQAAVPLSPRCRGGRVDQAGFE